MVPFREQFNKSFALLAEVCDRTVGKANHAYYETSWYFTEKYSNIAGWYAYRNVAEYRRLANERYWEMQTNAPVVTTRSEWDSRPGGWPVEWFTSVRMSEIENEVMLSFLAAEHDPQSVLYTTVNAAMDRVPAANWRQSVQEWRWRAETRARGYSSVDVWNVDSWVHKTLPAALTEFADTFHAENPALALNVEEAAYRVGWGGKGKDFTDFPSSNMPFRHALYDLVEEAYGWLADNAEELFLPDDETAAPVREWASTFAHLLRKMRAGSCSWPGEARGYASPQEWDWELERLAEHAEMYAKTGEAENLATVFNWLGKKVWQLWD